MSDYRDEEIESLRAKLEAAEKKIKLMRRSGKAYEKQVRTVLLNIDGRLDIVEAWMKFCNGLVMEIPSEKSAEGRRLAQSANSAIFENRPTISEF